MKQSLKAGLLKLKSGPRGEAHRIEQKRCLLGMNQSAARLCP